MLCHRAAHDVPTSPSVHFPALGWYEAARQLHVPPEQRGWVQAGRMADALLIASLGGQELWAKAQAAFMLKAPRPYMKIVAAVLKSDMPGAEPSFWPGFSCMRACYCMCLLGTVPQCLGWHWHIQNWSLGAAVLHVLLREFALGDGIFLVGAYVDRTGRSLLW